MHILYIESAILGVSLGSENKEQRCQGGQGVQGFIKRGEKTNKKLRRLATLILKTRGRGRDHVHVHVHARQACLKKQAPVQALASS